MFIGGLDTNLFAPRQPGQRPIRRTVFPLGSLSEMLFGGRLPREGRPAADLSSRRSEARGRLTQVKRKWLQKPNMDKRSLSLRISSPR
jgi:hypothetical protein